MDMDQALQTFISESRELLADMEDALLGVSDSDDPRDAVNAIFRAAHTIKGSAGLFGLQHIVDFTHVLESVLDRVRDGVLAMEDTLVSLLLASNDTLGRLVSLVQARIDTPDDELAQEIVALELRLSAYLDHEPAPGRVPAAHTADDTTDDTAGHWHISLRFHENVLRNGMDPLSLVRYLQRLGTLTGVACQMGRVPLLEAMDPEACYLGLEIGLDSSADEATIASAFEFVAEDCDIRIIAPADRLAGSASLIAQIGEPPAQIAGMLVRCATLSRAEAAPWLDSPAAPAIATSARRVAAAAEPPLPARSSPSRDKPADVRTVRVDAVKLDHLINLVGELITASAGASLASARAGNAELQTANAQVASLVEAVRDSTLQLRMVKIGATLNRFRRVVHDVSRQLGKRIELVVRGEDTELDKTVVERIGDPLTHLVRNAMDHGIESAETREAAGKPAHGTITLDARHDSGHIVIEVHDDGRGLDRERILAKARERGLIDGERVMTDGDVYNLVFEPGFSTADQVTDLSGRGVGMDVVKRNIEALRGSVEVQSRLGHRTTVVIRLPLTLAIIDGFQVTVGESRFILPLDMVDECIAYSADGEHRYTGLRGQVLPFIRLREMFDLPGQAAGRENIVVVRHGTQRIGLVVDNLLGETQAVIKPLSRVFAGVRGISGSSILGSGEVAVILDVPGLLAQAHHAPAHAGPAA